MVDARSFDVDLSSALSLPQQPGATHETPNVQLNCGALVLISASLRGKEQGCVMATASAEFEIVPFDPNFPRFYMQHFLFQIVCVEPPKRLAHKKIYAFRNQRFDVFMSSSSRRESLIARKTLGDHECFDISTPQWKVFQRGFTKPTPLSYKTLSKRKILRLFSSKTYSPLTFTLLKYEENGNEPPLLLPYSLPFEYEQEEEPHDFLSTFSTVSNDLPGSPDSSMMEDLDDFQSLQPHGAEPEKQLQLSEKQPKPKNQIGSSSFASVLGPTSSPSPISSTSPASSSSRASRRSSASSASTSPPSSPFSTSPQSPISPTSSTSFRASRRSSTSSPSPSASTSSQSSIFSPSPQSSTSPQSLSPPLLISPCSSPSPSPPLSSASTLSPPCLASHPSPHWYWKGKKGEEKHEKTHRQSEMVQVASGIGDLLFSPSSPREVEVPEDLLRALTKDYDNWSKLSDYFVSKHLRKFKLPHVMEIEEHEELYCPHFEEKSRVSRIEILKRFNSRKQPHLVRIYIASGQSEKFIFKEDDNVAMDVVVMDLIKRANSAWEKKGLGLHHRTYTIVATTKKTGFLECVPGDTVLKFSMEDILNSLQGSVEKWTSFLSSVYACMIMTAAFMITDRHHNNVMFTPSGDLCMIDLSASLGNKAPMDGVLHMNPVYLPKRIMRLCATAQDLHISPELDIDTLATEELLMTGYYALMRDQSIVILCKLFNWELPNAHKFLGWVQHRIVGHKQTKEGLRNRIVQTMDENHSVNNVIAFITSILPIN